MGILRHSIFSAAFVNQHFQSSLAFQRTLQIFKILPGHRFQGNKAAIIRDNDSCPVFDSILSAQSNRNDDLAFGGNAGFHFLDNLLMLLCYHKMLANENIQSGKSPPAKTIFKHYNSPMPLVSDHHNLFRQRNLTC